jgi:hypothetical protein
MGAHDELNREAVWRDLWIGVDLGVGELDDP